MFTCSFIQFLRVTLWALVHSYDIEPVFLSHPGIQGWLYVFVPVRMLPPPPASHSCPRDNFWTTFGFLSFLARWFAVTHGLTDYLLVDFRRHLDLEFSRSNIELAISQPKMVRLPRNEKQTHRLNSELQMWPSGLTLAMTLTLNFQGHMWSWPFGDQGQV